MTTILIIEDSLEGHRGPYIKWITKLLAESHIDVTLALMDQGETIPDYLLSSNLKIHQLKPSLARKIWLYRFSRLFREVVNYFDARRAYISSTKKTSTDFVLLPTLDFVMYALAVFGSPFGTTQWSGITMRPDFHFRNQGVRAHNVSQGAIIKRLLFERLIQQRQTPGILTIDESLANEYRDHPKVFFFPEPFEFPTPHVRRLKSNANPELNLLVYGAISNRKGVTELINGLRLLPSDFRLTVTIAGKGASVNKGISSELPPRVSINTIDRFISFDEESSLFAEADIVWLGYVGHTRSSGVLVQAGKAGKPIIACDIGLIEWQCRRHSLGIIVDVQDPKSVADALETLSNDSDFRLELGKNIFSRYEHSTYERSFQSIHRVICEGQVRTQANAQKIY